LLQIFNNFLVLIAVGRICIPARENAKILRGRALIVKASQESFDGRRNLPKDVKSFPLHHQQVSQTRVVNGIFFD
jgi:hypothetical protein